MCLVVIMTPVVAIALGYRDGSVKEMFDTIRSHALAEVTTHFATLDVDSDGVLSRGELHSASSLEHKLYKELGDDRDTGSRATGTSLFEVVQMLERYKPPGAKSWGGLSLAELRRLYATDPLKRVRPALADHDAQSTPMSDVCYPDPLVSNGFGSGSELWEGDPVPEGLRSRCDFAVAENTIDPALFKELYVDTRTPVLIRNMTSDWPASSLWNTAASLSKEYPDTELWVGYGHDLKEGGVKMTISEFLTHTAANTSVAGERPGYVTDNGLDNARFEVADQERSRHPLEDSRFPHVLDSLPASTKVLGMHFTAGGACTGTHIHVHNHAWCALVGGLKWWGIADSGGEFEAPEELEDFHYHARDYLNHLKMGSAEPWWEQRYDGMLECVQGAGDFLYVPAGYLHVVVNIWPSIGVAHEFGIPEEMEAREQAKVADAQRKEL